MRTDPDALMVFLLGKLAEAEKSLKGREMMAQVWSGGTDATWKEGGCRINKTKRKRLAEAEKRIAEKYRHEVAMFRALIVRIASQALLEESK